MSVKLRMLLKSASIDPGLVEITPFGAPRPEPGRKLERIHQRDRELDVDPVTREVFHEYLRGILSIELTFTASGEQTTSSFDEVREWAERHMQSGLMPLLDVTIDEVKP